MVGKRISGEEPEYKLQSTPPLGARTTSRNSRQQATLSEVEEQKVQTQGALPQDTQQSLLEQDAPEDEEEHTNPLEVDHDSDDSSDYSVEYKTTDIGKAVAYEEIDPAAQQISQEYETSRQGSVLQQSPINPAK